uniref:Uncharacterized protein n=1 Tax=Anopheles dirus TaxID=7168 RepID=A0A182MZ31_9DIPT
MKCIVAFVLVAATTLVVEASVIPLALAPGIAIAAPPGLVIPGATVIQSNPPATIVHALPAPIALDINGTPTLLLAPAPAAPAVVAVAPAPAATAVSATRGAVHVAPLPGHSVSQTQLNLAAAPGTEYANTENMLVARPVDVSDPHNQRTMKAFVTVLFVACVTNLTAAHSTNLALFTPYQPVHPLDEGYFPRPKHFEHVETGLLQEHPIVRFPDTAFQHFQPHALQHHQQQQHHHQDLFLPDSRYLSFVAPTASLVAYVPVHRGRPGPWAVPNVFIKGQGFSTNQYVAPALMKKFLAQDPR